MRLYLAGVESALDLVEQVKPPYILMSYASLAKVKDIETKIAYVKDPACKDWLLDSGAFTFYNSGEKKTVKEWEYYVDSLCDLINATGCKHFFELDIDTIVGLDQVERFRRQMERRTQKQCIPVWHSHRKFDYFKRMCDEYGYVSVGGVAKNPNGKNIIKVFPYLIEYAHKTETKIHGLGYTDFKHLNKYKFDSVDSTTWMAGARYGSLFTIDNNSIKQTRPPSGKRVDGKKANEYAMKVFTQYAKMLDTKGW